MPPTWLAIEIGGTKLQVAVGTTPGGKWLHHEQTFINPQEGAAGIVRQIETIARPPIARYQPQGVGIGFGGPVDARAGRAVTSHQIEGWDGFPLRQWCAEQFGLPLALANDCDAAALAEGAYGAGQGASRVFYVTVGTGVGGGCVLHGKLAGIDRPAIAEIGHLRYGIEATDPHDTVESLASGWGIAKQAQRFAQAARQADAALLLHANAIDATVGQAGVPDTRALAELALQGNPIARRAFDQGTRVLGWAIAQMLTLLAAEIVVIGGGVPQSGDTLFWNPLRSHVATYVFPPLRDSYSLRPAALGSEVVLHGALALAQSCQREN